LEQLINVFKVTFQLLEELQWSI